MTAATDRPEIQVSNPYVLPVATGEKPGDAKAALQNTGMSKAQATIDQHFGTPVIDGSSAGWSVGSTLTDARGYVDGAIDGAKDLGNRAVETVKEHPLEAMGYTAGALIGGAAAVAALPVEAGAAVVVGVAVAGAAVVDGAAYWLRRGIESEFGT